MTIDHAFSNKTSPVSKQISRYMLPPCKIRILAADSDHQIDRSTDHSERNDVTTRTQSTSGKRTANDQHGVAGPSGMAKKRKTPVNKSKDGEDVTEDEENEDEAQEGGSRYLIKTLALECTEADCDEMLPGRDALHDHLKNAHGLEPLSCLAQGCGQRFNNR